MADINYIIERARESEKEDIYEAKSWLIVAKSLNRNNINIQLQDFMLEKRQRNVKGCAQCFEVLFKQFHNNETVGEMIEEITEAVRIIHMTKDKVTEEQSFMGQLFSALPQEFQTDLLYKRTELTQNQYVKCQLMLLLLKLYPESETIPRNRPDLLINLLSFESDPYSPFRQHLVVELVPSLLESSIRENLTPSILPRLIQLLNLCIEYYVLAAKDQKDRWTNLFAIVDKIGVILSWNLMPFFTEIKSEGNVDGLYQAVVRAYERRKFYSSIECAYVICIAFLMSIVRYNELSQSNSEGGSSKLFLVEIFIPNRKPQPVGLDPHFPILTTVSNSSTISTNQTHLINYFLSASRLWELINLAKGEIVEKEFFTLLSSLKWLKINEWVVFQEFTLDYQVYSGKFYLPDPFIILNHLKLSSYFCAVNNYKAAVESSIRAINDLVHEKSIGKDLRAGSNKEEFSFYNSTQTDLKGNVLQRRVHFLSENPSELIAYAVNILIRCFYETVDVNHDDRCIGHLMTLLQLEWPSPPAEIIFGHILELINKKTSFRYFPFFGDFIIEPDFLENFMALANRSDSKQKLHLDIWPTSGAVAISGRRMATRGVDKGHKNEFCSNMRRQMMKNGRESLENIILKFLTLNKNDIITCFDSPFKH